MALGLKTIDGVKKISGLNLPDFEENNGSSSLALPQRQHVELGTWRPGDGMATAHPNEGPADRDFNQIC